MAVLKDDDDDDDDDDDEFDASVLADEWCFNRSKKVYMSVTSRLRPEKAQ